MDRVKERHRYYVDSEDGPDGPRTSPASSSVSMKTILAYTLSLQKEVKDYKAESERRRLTFEEEMNQLRRENILVKRENEKLLEENELLRRQLKRTSHTLRNIHSSFQIDSIEKSPEKRPLFQFRRSDLTTTGTSGTSEEDEDRAETSFRSYQRREPPAAVQSSQTQTKRFPDSFARRSPIPEPTFSPVLRPSTAGNSSSSPLRESSPTFSRRKVSASTTAPSRGGRRRAQSVSKSMTFGRRRSKRGGGGGGLRRSSHRRRSIFDRLTDPSLYTGVYAERFRGGSGGINQFDRKVTSLSQITRPNLSYSQS